MNPTPQAVLSLVDVNAESALLRSHDLLALHARLEGTIRRRQAALAFLAGAAAVALAGGIAWVAIQAPTTTTSTPLVAPAAPAPVAAALPRLDPVVASAPCPAFEPQPPPIVVARPVRRPPIVVEPVVVPPVVASDDGERVGVEGSRLRAQLRIFDDGERALVGGDPERALARALHLREKYPNGPLDIDAALLGVRALRALQRDDEARTALAAVEQHALATEKTAAIAELRALLTIKQAADDDDAVASGVTP
ncbi:MAG: hypothetical protein Q8O67_23480 [Deltaproteobacteria bacterium]|nr:hypothetical protein [Deltaproteobacteria bacterium]